VLLVQGRGELAFMPSVTAVLLHHSAMDTGPDCNIFSTGKRRIGGSPNSYCNTLTSLNNDLNILLYHNIVQYFPTDSPLRKFIHPF